MLRHLYTPSVTCLGEPRRPNITRDGSGPGITGAMAIGVNMENAIRCTARARIEFMGTNVLSDLFWQYSNGTRLPAVDTGQSSGHDLYVEGYSVGGSINSARWFRVLHFKTTTPSVVGNYTCVANYNRRYNWNQSVEILVSGEWKDALAWVAMHTSSQASTVLSQVGNNVLWITFTWDMSILLPI